MQGESILQTIAEVSVAFAGFTGVVVAFGRRPGHDDSPTNAHAFKAMLASSLQALIFAVLPFFAVACGVGEPGLWRVTSAFMLVGLAIGATMDVGFARRVDRDEWTGLDRSLEIGIAILGVAAIAAQALNVFGAVDRPFAPYLGGLLFFLCFSSAMFVRLLTAPDRPGRETLR